MQGIGVARYQALDGLRGIAACVVLIHHCCLVSPELAEAVDSNGRGTFEPWTWWTVFSPLHLFWAGQEAVFVFFILSGFVLTLPRLRGRPQSWPAYYCKRIARIFPPVWASLGLAVITVWIAPRIADPDLSSWVNKHQEPTNAFIDGALLFGASSLNSPLWSLRWEVLFSLLLPMFCIGVCRFRQAWMLRMAGLLMTIGLGDILEEDVLVFLPMFGLGVLMASHVEVLSAWAAKFRSSTWCGLLTVTLIFLLSRWILPGIPAANALSAVGGVLLLFMFVGSKGTSMIGSAPALQWLGKLSFSLYLTHEPVVVSVALVTHSDEPVVVGLIAVPLSIALAVAFSALVERPSLRLASTVGDLVDKTSWRPRLWSQGRESRIQNKEPSRN
ncbi:MULTISPECIES: acyltransferase family protein [Micrococcaceae]|uniref:acyltransferase family protein n=1 Tax=Micrococcaceae TaxID=1268 RepID=UPI0006F4261F|nr:MULTISPECIES: acyltransferase [unclassified Arthrobacter]KRE76479.1 hypothetical protein ASG79_18660 [Arthrobacter sp. Soil761]TWD52869.1 peptidoglycan/LPS O-acetylase OafA/YrhL [Arthrobacter sp. AG367]